MDDSFKVEMLEEYVIAFIRNQFNLETQVQFVSDGWKICIFPDPPTYFDFNSVPVGPQRVISRFPMRLKTKYLDIFIDYVYDESTNKVYIWERI